MAREIRFRAVSNMPVFDPTSPSCFQSDQLFSVFPGAVINGQNIEAGEHCMFTSELIALRDPDDEGLPVSLSSYEARLQDLLKRLF